MRFRPKKLASTAAITTLSAPWSRERKTRTTVETPIDNHEYAPLAPPPAGSAAGKLRPTHRATGKPTAVEGDALNAGTVRIYSWLLADPEVMQTGRCQVLRAEEAADQR